MIKDAMIAFFKSAFSGLVMALVMPAAINIARKLAFTASRSGSPNETLLAPQTVLQPSSSFTQRTICSTCAPAPATAPAGITSGSMRMSSRGMP